MKSDLGSFLLECYVRREDAQALVNKQFDFASMAIRSVVLARESGLFEKIVLRQMIGKEWVQVAPTLELVE